jgi:hypothetical protein
MRRLVGFIFLGISILFISCDRETQSEMIEPSPPKTCISISGTNVTFTQFWKDGRSQSFRFMGETGSKTIITDGQSGEQITVEFSNIRYLGFMVSSFSAQLDGGKFNHEKMAYPAEKCN